MTEKAWWNDGISKCDQIPTRQFYFMVHIFAEYFDIFWFNGHIFDYKSIIE